MFLLVLGLPAFAKPSDFDAIEIVVPHGESSVYTRKEFPTAFPKADFVVHHEAMGILFNISYEDVDTGFRDPVFGEDARQCLEEVLAYIADVLRYGSGELDVQVMASELDGTGPIASAGTPYPFAPGIHPGATLHRLNTGEKLADFIPEITLKVDFGWPFAMGDDAPGPDEFDLRTVLLHEMTHGIGFTTRISSSGGSLSFPGGYSAFDALLTDRSGNPLLDLEGLVPIFQADPSVLVMFNTAFRGTYAMAQYGEGVPVPVYASPPFQPGSSVAHWAFGSVAGDVLMEPRLARGAMLREYAPEDLGAVIDLKNFSRGDGRPGEGATGCIARARESGGGTARGDLSLMGLTLLVMAGAAVTRRKKSGKI